MAPHGEIRVMAVAEGYAMVRYRGCVPWCISVRDLMNLPKSAPAQFHSPPEKP
jgi:hypothetical protein